MTHVSRLGTVLFGGVTAITACGASDAIDEIDEEIASNDQRVIGGREEEAFVAAGYLVREGIASCSAVLIEPDLVLTAAHCVDGHQDIRFGWGGVGEDKTVQTIARAVHPRYVMPRKNGGVAFEGFDVALLRLEHAPDVAPAALGVPERFEKVRAVGYGATSYERGESGTREPRGVGTERRSIEGTIQGQSPTEVFVQFGQDMAACYGDSGGPLFSEAEGKVIAVLSRFTELGRCLPKDHSLMGYIRVDAMSDFFREAQICMQEADTQGCLHEDARALCDTPRFENRIVPRALKATGSTSFDLVDGEERLMEVTPDANLHITIDPTGDARMRVTRAGEREPIANRSTTADLEGGAKYSVAIRSCNGKKQSVELTWKPR